jgi:flagellum-specific peptidoglycan hydrolase FlgJ
MTPQEFIAWLGPAAQVICKQYRLFASVCVAQAALESGWGKYTIGEYNLFGRKWDGHGSYIETTTQEYLNEQWVTITDKFADYANLEEAIADWCMLLTEEPLYADCLNYLQDREGFVKTIGPVYATDPAYADKVLSIIDTYGLAELD